MAATTTTDPKLTRAIKASLKAYAAADRKFFDFLKDDVRVFNVNDTEPMLGREKFESAFAKNFKIKRKVATLASDIQLSGSQAILSQTLRITANDVSSQVRQTVVWQQDDETGEWKISHIHNALVGQPIVSGKAPKDLRAIKVLNERIATVAATVGVAQ